MADIPRTVSWRVVKNLVKYAPRGSAIFQEIAGVDGLWKQSDHLLASVYDVLSAANWQRSGDPGADRPAPYPRPGVEVPERDGKSHHGTAPVGIDEFNSWWKMEVGA